MNLISFERWARNRLAELIGLLFPLPKMDAESVRKTWERGKIRKVLFIRPHQGIGDLLVATPVLRAMKLSRPDATFHLVATPQNVGAVLGNPRLDRIWTWNKKKARAPGYLVSLIKNLRAEKYDLAVIISSHTPSFTSFVLARACGAKIVWAFETQPHYDGANWSRWMASVSLPNPASNIPEWEKFIQIVKPLGLQGSGELDYHVPADIQAWADQYWKNYFFPAGRPVVAFFLGGNPNHPKRFWLAEEWAKLGRLLIDTLQVSLLAIVPPKTLISEKGFYEEFATHLGQRIPFFDEPGLKQAAAILSHVDLFICPDGGLMHIAIGTQIPTVGLFFSTDPMRWVAPVSWAVGLRSPDGLPTGLSAERVYSLVVDRLKLIESK